MTILTKELAQKLVDEQGLNLVVPDLYTSIENHVLELVTNQQKRLASISLPNSIITIGAEAFAGQNLKSVTIPNSTRTIKFGAFMGSWIKDLHIGEKVETISNNAFINNQITRIAIPDSLTSLGVGAFANNQLEEVSIGNNIAQIQDRTFSNNKLTSIVIPDNVTRIGNGAFAFNQLTDVVIPDAVVAIDDYAFASNNIKSIKLHANISTIGNGTFSTNQLTSIDIPDGITSIGESSFRRNELTSVNLPSSITYIGDYAFENNNLESITIPSSVTHIGRGAFQSNQITSIEIPENVVWIGRDAFKYNSSLKYIYVAKDAKFDLSNLPSDSKIIVKGANQIPADISITATTINENITAGSAVANLSTSDPDSGDTHTYSLVNGTGSTDNTAFTIIGDQLKINATPDYETQDSYSVRVQTEDSGGLTFEKSFTFTVNDLNEDPTNLLVSESTFEENIAAGSAVATLSSTDPDDGDTHTYSLVSGDGNTDNNAFTIVGDQVKIKASPDYETKDSYLVRLRTTDSGGLSFERSFTFTVDDLGDKNPNQNTYPTIEWTQLLGTLSLDQGTSISTSADGSIYITGYTYGDLDGQTNNGWHDAFITKYNSNGSKQWTQLLGTSERDSGYSISTADDGSVYVTGETLGDLDGQTNSGLGDAFITKYNSDGSKQWTQLLGTSSWDYGYSISTTDDGSIYITGRTLGDLNGQTNSGIYDAFISKYSNDGSKQWTQLLGSSAADSGYSISTAKDGSIYISGTTFGNLDGQTNSGGSDAFISKYNSDGSKQWTQLLGTSTADDGYSISTADNGSIYISGVTPGDLDGQSNSGAKDVFISKFAFNKPPTNLLVSTSTFDENIPSGTAVATLSTIDSDEGDKHTYSLDSKDKYPDNSAFVINGDKLEIIDSPDFETKSTYSIRIKAIDSSGLTFEKSFTLEVNDVHEASDSLVYSVSGKGKLRGTEKADQFTFNQFEPFGRKTADKIINFNSSQGDTIGVSGAAFPSLQGSKEVRVASANTKKQLEILSKTDYDFIYYEKKGRLFFNGNGEAKGWGDANEGGLFAILKGKPELSAGDFTLLA